MAAQGLASAATGTTGAPAAAGPGPAGPPTADGEVIRELWHLHGSSLLRFAAQLTAGDQQRAEDVIQETWLRAWRHPEVLHDLRLSRPWLRTVAQRVVIDLWRRDQARPALALDDLTADPAAGIDETIRALDVRAALGQLTPEHRQVIVAMYYEDKSVAEISHALGVPPGTVKSRLHYGLRHLARQLAAGDATEDLPRAS